MVLSHFIEHWVIEDDASSQRTPSLGDDRHLLVEIKHWLLGQVGMGFNLIDYWHFIRLGLQ